MLGQLRLILDDMGEGPLIVRSSSLLEDSKGRLSPASTAASFWRTPGTKEERLAALADAVAEVYASIFNPDAIQYRAERGLLDYYEEMGVLIQRVVGTRVGRYFFPAFAGVAFGNNEFRWSPRIRREDGVSADCRRTGDPGRGPRQQRLSRPDQPRASRTSGSTSCPKQIVHYSQKHIDVINMETRRFETHPIDEIIREVGTDVPALGPHSSRSMTGARSARPTGP